MVEDISTKEQIYLITDTSSFPDTGFILATKIANAHEKGICFLSINEGKNERIEEKELKLKEWCQEKKVSVSKDITYHILDETDDFTDFMERNEAAAVIFELTETGLFKNCKYALKICRNLRIPYYFVKNQQTINFDKVLVPIGFLIEEQEKGIFCSGMGRFFQSEILLMPAKDYGSRTKQNTDKIKTLLDKFNLKYQCIQAKKNSFKIELEAVQKTEELNVGLLLISASRDYGMDDIIFGPKEQKVINKSKVPIMVINPRKDLYALCS